MNDIYDYVHAWANWVGRDETSKAKFALDVAEKFNVPAEKAESLVNQYVTYPPPKLEFDVLARRFCENGPTPRDLLTAMQTTKEKYPTTVGWLLFQCQMMDSSKFGMRVLKPYGPEGHTFTEVPILPVSLDGSASGTFTVIGTFPVEALPTELPEGLRDWVAPAPEAPVKKKRGRKAK